MWNLFWFFFFFHIYHLSMPGFPSLDTAICRRTAFLKWLTSVCCSVRRPSLAWKWKSLSHIQLFVTPWTIQSMEFSSPEYWSGYPFHSPGDLLNPRFKPRSPTLQADSLPAKPQGKPKNTGVGSLSLHQQIFLTQELNCSLLHCRQILYELNHQGSPEIYLKCILKLNL